MFHTGGNAENIVAIEIDVCLPGNSRTLLLCQIAVKDGDIFNLFIFSYFWQIYIFRKWE